jgi:hypothetical protein
MNAYTKRYPDELMLRGPNMQELMEIDKMLHSEIHKLVNEMKWSLDDAMHEMSTVRSDLTTLMQPRARLPKAITNFQPQRNNQPQQQKGGKGQQFPSQNNGGYQQNWGNSSKGNNAPWQQQKGDGKQGGKNKGGKGGQKGDRSRTPSSSGTSEWNPAWATHTTHSDTEPSRPFCRRHHTGECGQPTFCRFSHKCPVKTTQGEPCMGNHRASQCSMARGRPPY